MLMRMWRTGPCALFRKHEMVDAVENNMEDAQKKSLNLSCDPAVLLQGSQTICVSIDGTDKMWHPKMNPSL